MPMNPRLLRPLARFQAPAGPFTLYFNGAVDNDWATLGNWWLDDEHTVPATALPTAGDSAIATASIDSNSSSEPTMVNFTMDGDGGNNFLGTNITATGTVSFTNYLEVYETITAPLVTFSTGSNTQGGSIVGDAVFNDDSSNNATVTGNATFDDSSQNGGDATVTGNATFDSESFNNGTVTGNATFNSDSHNGGIVTGNATFNNDSYNSGSVTGNATFRNNCVTDGTIGGNAVFYDSAQAQSGGDGIYGSATFYNISRNSGIIGGNAVFNDSAENELSGVIDNAAVGGSVEFFGSSKNYGTIGSLSYYNVLFEGFSDCRNYGNINGTVTFANESQFYSGTVSDAIFVDDACNVNGNAQGFTPNPPPSC